MPSKNPVTKPVERDGSLRIGNPALQQICPVPHPEFNTYTFNPRFGHAPAATTHAPPARAHPLTAVVGVGVGLALTHANDGQFRPSGHSAPGVAMHVCPGKHRVTPSGHTIVAAGVAEACTVTDGTGSGVETGLGKH